LPEGHDKRHPRDYNDLNYCLLLNKDGKYAWRPITLINPILYVSLVRKITEQENWDHILNKFREFRANRNIECTSIPIKSLTKQSNKTQQILKWVNCVEERSVSLALEYSNLIHLDISNCYGSIYTHSFSWAMHGKEYSKKPENRRNRDLIGNVIDGLIQDMSYGQTNGIPQGSVLMDFFAEIVLGYADSLLSDEIKRKEIEDYKIIRHRDDYRIFTNNIRTGEEIVKLITETIQKLGMSLNSKKTRFCEEAIINSIKKDKMFLMNNINLKSNLENFILSIYEFSNSFPNSNQTNKLLEIFYKKIYKKKNIKNIYYLLSIVVNIAYHNPVTYPICASIISKLLDLTKDRETRESFLEKIRNKFGNISHISHFMIWLQRITLCYKRKETYEENLCKLVAGEDIEIWNTEWLSNNIKEIIRSKDIISEIEINKITNVIMPNEVSFFKY
jgi:RNA-directed DNA polymerase